MSKTELTGGAKINRIFHERFPFELVKVLYYIYNVHVYQICSLAYCMNFVANCKSFLHEILGVPHPPIYNWSRTQQSFFMKCSLPSDRSAKVSCYTVLWVLIPALSSCFCHYSQYNLLLWKRLYKVLYTLGIPNSRERELSVYVCSEIVLKHSIEFEILRTSCPWADR